MIVYKRLKKILLNKNGLKLKGHFMNRNNIMVLYWHLFDILGGLSSMKQWESVGLAQHDKIHFTAIGYNLIVIII
jgi:hypothetical protein